MSNKLGLQEYMGLPVREDVPLMGMVSRLVSHKGLDLVKAVLDELLETTDIQVVVLGSGDWEYENFFREAAARHPGKLAIRIGFVPDLARKIYAGSDLFLMPSKSEPCGLSQMVALRYGSIPIVRETGGLRDSIKDSGDGEATALPLPIITRMKCSTRSAAPWKAIKIKRVGRCLSSVHWSATVVGAARPMHISGSINPCWKAKCVS